jgi:hypothetical protein
VEIELACRDAVPRVRMVGAQCLAQSSGWRFYSAGGVHRAGRRQGPGVPALQEGGAQVTRRQRGGKGRGARQLHRLQAAAQQRGDAGTLAFTASDPQVGWRQCARGGACGRAWWGLDRPLVRYLAQEEGTLRPQGRWGQPGSNLEKGDDLPHVTLDGDKRRCNAFVSLVRNSPRCKCQVQSANTAAASTTDR